MKWTQEEFEYLQDRWGDVSITGIATVLKKSINSVKEKAFRSGLKRHIHAGEFITFNQLMHALGRKNCGGHVNTSWIKNRDFPVKFKKSITKKYKVVYLDDFWEWAYKNRLFVDFAKAEKDFIGWEPDWVKEQRIADIKYAAYKKDCWTKDEDSILKQLLSRYEYSYRDISIRLKRTEGAIKQRIRELKIKSTPVRADNHTPWTAEENELLKKLLEKGCRPEVIAEDINRSAMAIRGKIERNEKMVS